MSIDATESAVTPGQPHPSGDPGCPDAGGIAPPARGFPSVLEEQRGQPPAGAAFAPPARGCPAASPFPQTLDFLLDVRISLSVEVGRVQMPVRQVMELGPGAIIELQRSASEPVEIHANGKCIGRGEIVVVGEQFGVRITELGPPA